MTTNNSSVKRPDGVTLIAVLQFISGGLGILALMVMLIVGLVMLAVPANGAMAILLMLFLCGLLIIACSLLSIAAGVGLLRLSNWARWVTIIMAILSLPAFPIGTVIGGLIIWYLLQDSVTALFEKRIIMQPVQPVQPAQPAQVIQPTQPVEPAQPESLAPETPPDVTIPPAAE